MPVNLVSLSTNADRNASIMRERHARLGSRRASRPVPPVYQHLPEFPVLVQPTICSRSAKANSRLSSASSLSSLPIAIFEQTVTRSPSTPTYWAGLSLDANPKLLATITAPSPVAFRAAQRPSTTSLSGSWGAPGDGEKGSVKGEEESHFPAEAMLTSMMPFKGTPWGEPVLRRGLDHTTRPATSYLHGGITLPPHMTKHPASGQWLM
mmetsp:Transcript_1357/g.2107  ORF Transcript_1357/g.2107 Transcript_1357/m.2107 type:complete len:208 (+) Transcript_1357:106-729(+)